MTTRKFARAWYCRSLAIAAAAAVALAAASARATAQGGTPQSGTAQSGAGAVKRGEHLVNVSGCHDCHTPWKMGAEGPEPDMALALSGHPQAMQLPPAPEPKGPWVGAFIATNTAWAGPWGTSFTANLTPDPETGLGTWTEQQFIETIRNGRRQGRGRQLLPPMPWPAYRNYSDDDLKAIFAYLKSIKPIKNKVPEPVIAAPPQ